MLVALMTAAFVAAPVIDAQGRGVSLFGDTDAVCRLYSKRFDTLCCESCAPPYLLDQTFLATAENVNSVNQNIEFNVELGSGDDALNIDAGAEVQVASVVRKEKPCGVCVRPDKCLETGGFVNTWHRICSRRP